jgi:hypothetical protein
LDHRLDDLLGCLMQTGVDDFESGVSEGPRDDFRPSIVSVESGLGNDDSVRTIH